MLSSSVLTPGWASESPFTAKKLGTAHRWEKCIGAVEKFEAPDLGVFGLDPVQAAPHARYQQDPDGTVQLAEQLHWPFQRSTCLGGSWQWSWSNTGEKRCLTVSCEHRQCFWVTQISRRPEASGNSYTLPKMWFSPPLFKKRKLNIVTIFNQISYQASITCLLHLRTPLARWRMGSPDKDHRNDFLQHIFYSHVDMQWGAICFPPRAWPLGDLWATTGSFTYM